MTDNLTTILDSEIELVLGTFIETGLVDAALKHTLDLK
jgi:hypothetical protein